MEWGLGALLSLKRFLYSFGCSSILLDGCIIGMYILLFSSIFFFRHKLPMQPLSLWCLKIAKVRETELMQKPIMRQILKQKRRLKNFKKSWIKLKLKNLIKSLHSSSNKILLKNNYGSHTWFTFYTFYPVFLLLTLFLDSRKVFSPVIRNPKMSGCI